MEEYYKFECDFYYLHYDISDKFNGTIYRHYDNDNDNDKIEYIHGCNDTKTNDLYNTKKNIFLSDLKKLKEGLISINVIKKDHLNNYLNMYDFNTANYEKYYKKLSLCYLCDENCIPGLIDINMDEPIINIGMLFTFIETDKFDFNNVNIRYKHQSGKSISFNDYLYNLNKSSKSSKSRNKSSRSKSSRSKRNGGMVSYPGITKITTEQNFIYYETINHYTANTLTDLMPVIIEYDIDKSQFIIVDGNHRVAYHIINKFKYIPVLIIFKNLFIDI